MPVVDTSPEVQVAQLGKEPAAPTHEEESSVECDIIPLIEDRREPIEDAETASDDRASAEPPTPSAQLRNPVSLATPSRAFLREEATIETVVQSNIPSPSKPTITIDRRARSMPASPTNSIASIVYTGPPTNKESFLGVDVSEVIPLDSSAKKESRSRIVLNEVIENDDDTMATDHARHTQDKPVVEVEEEVIRDAATPASPTPSGMSSEHTLDELYQSMLSQLNFDGSVVEYSKAALTASAENGNTSKPQGAVLARMSEDQTLGDLHESRNVEHDSASATVTQTLEKKAETIPSRVSRIGRSSAANVRTSSRRRARQLSGLGKHFADSSKTTIADSSKVVASKTKSLAATSSRRLSSTSKSIGSKSKSIAYASKSVAANVRARSKSRVGDVRKQRQVCQTSDDCAPVAMAAENQEEQEVNSTDSTENITMDEKSIEADGYIPGQIAVEEFNGASAEESLEVLVFALETTSDETVKTTNKTGVAEEVPVDCHGKAVDPDAMSKAASNASTIKSTTDDSNTSACSETNALDLNSTDTTVHSTGTARPVDDKPASTAEEVNSNASTTAIGQSSTANIRASSRKRAPQLSGLGKKFSGSSKSFASTSAKIISSTSKSIASSSKSAVANARARSRSRLRGSKVPPREEGKPVELEVNEPPPVEAVEDNSKESSGAETDERDFTTRASPRKRAQQLSGLKKKITDSSKTIASKSSKTISTTSTSIAMSSRSAVDNVRARSRSRVPSAERQSEENSFVEESSEKVEECFPGKLLDENQPVENQNNEVIVTMEDERKSVDQTNSTDDNQLSYNFPEERGESIITDSMTPCDADDGDTEESAHITTLDAAPTSPSPPKASLSGFMDGFRNFSRITEQFFCKTEEYLGDFAIICGGEATSASTMEANTTRQEKGVVDLPVEPNKDEPTMNSVEVSPIFDEPEPLVVQPVDGISSFGGDSRPSAEEKMPLPTEIEPILASVEPAHSIELGQSSSLRSTKSNKSLTLLTEVETKPSTESEKVAAAEPSEHLPVDSVDGASVSAALASCEEERRQSEMKSTEKQSSLVSTEVIHVESLKGHGGRKNFKIRKSFFKKPGLGRVDGSTHDNEDINEPQAPFSVMKSLKTGLKQLSPRANGGYKGFSKPKGTDSVDECVSSDETRSSSQKPTDRYDAEGVRVYGGGVTVAINEPTQYPKHPLNYRRKKSGIRRHVDHMRETAKNMNKVLQKRIVTASQPRMKAIMTNHVYCKDQASNRLH